MVDSEVPIPPAKARSDLIALLTDNLDDYLVPESDEELIVEGWRKLCKHYSPIFLEKSPHHLCQWSALELILEQIQKVDDVDVLVIGLVRNPMDTLYSQYTRWRTAPERVEKQWLLAYQNLLELKEILGEQLVIIRYEDIVSSLDCMQPIFRFCGTTASRADDDFLHQKSLQQWKSDKLFGFSLSEETLALSEKYGYTREELANKAHPFWFLARRTLRLIHLIVSPTRTFLLMLLNKGRGLLRG